MRLVSVSDAAGLIDLLSPTFLAALLLLLLASPLSLLFSSETPAMIITRLVCSALFALVVAGTAEISASAEPTPAAEPTDWMFQRSYYSHDPVAYVEVGRRGTFGGPDYPRSWGAYIRSGYSYQQGFIRAGGRVMEWNRSWDSYVQAGARN